MDRRSEETPLTIARRVAAYVRREMHERDMGLNKMAKKVRSTPGTISRLLSESRAHKDGPSAWFVYNVARELGIKAHVLLEDDPDARWFVRGSEYRHGHPQGGGRPRKNPIPTAASGAGQGRGQ